MKIRLLIVAAVAFLISNTGLPAGDEVVVLSKDNLLVLDGVVDSESVARVMGRASTLDSGIFRTSKPMYLYLNTPGGDIVQGLKLIDYLNGLRRKTSTVTVFAASMGFQIVQNLGERLILPHGIMMSHRARGGVEGEFGGVSPSQLESRIGLWMTIVKEMDQQTVDRTNGKQTLESYEKSFVPELWRTAPNSVRDGYSDKIVTLRCDSSLSGFADRYVNMGGILIKYHVALCPLNSGVSDVSAEIKTTQGLMDVTQFVADGGSFSPECLVLFGQNPNKLCSLDTNLNVERILNIKQEFIEKYNAVGEHTTVQRQ